MNLCLVPFRSIHWRQHALCYLSEQYTVLGSLWKNWGEKIQTKWAYQSAGTFPIWEKELSWDVLRMEVREILTLLFSWRLVEFFLRHKLGWDKSWQAQGRFQSCGPIWCMPSALYPFLTFLTLSYYLSSSVLWVLCLVVPWVLECISNIDVSVALLPDCSCSAAPLPDCYQRAHPFCPHPATGLGNLFHQSIPLPPPLWHFGDDFEH